MRRYLAAVFVLAAACANTPPAQPPAAAPSFDGDRAFEHLRRIVAIGPRVSGTPGAEATRAYILKELSALGLEGEVLPFEAATPRGTVKMANVRVTLPGSGQGRLIVGGHFDTKRFDNETFVGANDGGSSTAFLLELARVLKSRRNALPIEILFLDGEEAVVEWSLDRDSTYGSRHYVEAARRGGTLKDIRAFILVDMIGDRSLELKRDANSTPWLNDIFWSAARTLGRTEFADAETIVEDDHIPFIRAGVPAIDLIDLEYPDASNRFWHTPQDTLDKCSAASLKVVGDVLLAALPAVETRVK